MIKKINTKEVPKKIGKTKITTESKAKKAGAPKEKPRKELVKKATPRVSAAAKKEPEVSLVPSPEKVTDISQGRYWEAIGRRKTAVARVRLFTKGEKGVWVNNKPNQIYFQYQEFQEVAEEALKKMKSLERFRVLAKVSGGGLHAQAEAIRHGTARVLVKFNPDFRKRLKRAGFLTRDPRMKERKKFGLKGARRAPQWQKR